MNLLDLAQKHVQLRKVSSTKGGEWHGPCPWCGGSDRFHVWPNQDGGRGTYWCRSCGKGGDAIQYLRDHDGMTFKEACDALQIHIEEKTYKQADTTPREFTPRETQTPADLWQEKAEKFTTWAQGHLDNNKEALEWLAARGISREAADKYRLGWNPGEEGKDLYRQRKAWGLPEILKANGKPKAIWLPIGLVIPYIHPEDNIINRLQVRLPEPIGDMRYYWVPGGVNATMLLDSTRRAFVVVESALDAIACASATNLAGALALGTLEGKPDAVAYKTLKGATQILNALDFGDQGGGKDAAKRAMKWWSEQFGDKCERRPVPKGKDPGEAFAAGVDLEQWIKGGLWPVLRLEEKKDSPSVAPSPENATTGKIAGLSETEMTEKVSSLGLSPLIAELWQLLRRNPAVKIINRPERFTILRGNKPGVGGRIQELIVREPVVMDYILDHGAEEIDGKNLIKI
jgi:DNA primase